MKRSQIKNVAILIADDWSPIAGCYGDPLIQTPHIDALASRGMRFTNAFCTSPSCGPSRACLLTGLHTHAHGQYGHAHGPNHFAIFDHLPTLPTLLQAHGVFTGMIGKRHFKPEALFRWSFEKPEDCDPYDPGSLVTEFVKASNGQPFFLYLGSRTPHRRGDGFTTENLEKLPGVAYAPEEVPVPDFLPDIPKVRKDLSNYYTAISRFDYGIGETIAALEREGVLDETLIFVMSDHGMPFLGAKGSPFDAGHRCPLIIANTRNEPSSVSDAMVNWLDIMPTVLEIFSAEIPESLHGRSLVPVLEGEADASDWDSTTFSHTFHEVTNYYPYRTIRTRRWKYQICLFPELAMPIPLDIWNYRDRPLREQRGKRTLSQTLFHPPEALYDIIEDPMESKNLIESSEHETLIRSFREKMTAFRERTSDVWLRATEQRKVLEKLVKEGKLFVPSA